MAVLAALIPTTCAGMLIHLHDHKEKVSDLDLWVEEEKIMTSLTSRPEACLEGMGYALEHFTLGPFFSHEADAGRYRMYIYISRMGCHSELQKSALGIPFNSRHLRPRLTSPDINPTPSPKPQQSTRHPPITATMRFTTLTLLLTLATPLFALTIRPYYQNPTLAEVWGAAACHMRGNCKDEKRAVHERETACIALGTC